MISEVKKVCFVGAGTMGCFNSLITAMAGYDVTLYDIYPDALNAALERQKNLGDLMIRYEQTTEEILASGLTRVRYTANTSEAVIDADILSESVPERLELKRIVHYDFDKICPNHTIMTTNTSGFLVSEIEDVVKRKDRFAAFHFHLLGKTIDIVKGSGTSPQTIDVLKRFAKSLGQTGVILKKEKVGYIHNTMFLAFLTEAILLVLEGYADKEDVDRSWMAARGELSGPFGMMDSVGIDVIHDIFESKYERNGDPRDKKVINFLRPYLNRGQLGMKTGNGFYNYPDAIWMSPDFLN